MQFVLHCARYFLRLVAAPQFTLPGIGYLLHLLTLPVMAIVVMWNFLSSSRYDPVITFKAFSGVTAYKDPVVFDFHDLPTEYFHQFSDVSCLGPFDSASSARSELRAVVNAPKMVVDKLAEIGIRDERSTTKTLLDSTNDMETNGKGFYYFAHIETAFDPLASAYLTCVAVSGVEFRTAEVVVDYKVTEWNENIGDKPCHCGLVWCEKCPQIEKRSRREPVMKRNVLSFQQQAHLADWLEERAVSQIKKAPLHLPYSRTEALLMRAASSLGGVRQLAD